MARKEYAVDKILDKRIKYNRTEYLISWEGYDSDKNCWLPKKNLNCPAKLAEFEASLEDKKNKILDGKKNYKNKTLFASDKNVEFVSSDSPSVSFEKDHQNIKNCNGQNEESILKPIQSESDNESETKGTKESSEIDHIEQDKAKNDRDVSSYFIGGEIISEINDYNNKSDLSNGNSPLVDAQFNDGNTFEFNSEYFNTKKSDLSTDGTTLVDAQFNDSNTSIFNSEYFSTKSKPIIESKTTETRDSSASIIDHTEKHESDVSKNKEGYAESKSNEKKVQQKYRKRNRSITNFSKKKHTINQSKKKPLTDGKSDNGIYFFASQQNEESDLSDSPSFSSEEDKQCAKKFKSQNNESILDYVQSKSETTDTSEITDTSDLSASTIDHTDQDESVLSRIEKSSAESKSSGRQVQQKYRKHKRSACSVHKSMLIEAQNIQVGNHEHEHKRKSIAHNSVQIHTTKTPTYDQSLAMAVLKLRDIQKLYKKGKILPVLPSQNEKKSQMYGVVRRLSKKNDRKIIPHFFWCSICETLLNINTSTHYPALTRHYNKCIESQAKEQLLGNSGRKNLQQMIEDIMKISSDPGRVDLSSVKLPEVFSKENCDAYIARIRILVETQRHKTISTWVETEMCN